MSAVPFTWRLVTGPPKPSLTPSSCAARWAPFLTTDQNEPSSLCVTIANVRPLPCVWLTDDDPPPDAAVEPPALLDDVLLLPPPHAATTTAATARKARG